MIEVVLDTNVFVSAIFWGGTPFQIFTAWQEKKLQIVFSNEILDEYIRVSQLLGKKYCSKQDINAILETVTTYGKFVTPAHIDKPISRDPDDDKFIACALGADCQIIISGDKDLVDITEYAGIKIIKPAEFINQYLSST